LAPQAESWDALNAMWVRGRAGIKDSGLGVKDRRYVMQSLASCVHYSTEAERRSVIQDNELTCRYVLWALSRFSQGDSPSDFIEPAKAAKKFRG